MIEYAIPGQPTNTIPADVESWTVSPNYMVVPWHCPVCEQLVAETIAQDRDPEARTIVRGFDPVRMRAAEADGVPFYGMSGRSMRGRSERRSVARLATKAQGRAIEQRGASVPQADYRPIEFAEFDTLCANCPRRLRIRLPSG